jgi:broad specificity polyphosphatase/5'/3'-nucleotidase SurE
MAETCGYRQSDLPSIATSRKQQDSSENTNIPTLTQEVAMLSKTVSELVISKQSGQSNSLNQPSYSFSPQQNVQLTCYSCNFPGHKRKIVIGMANFNQRRGNANYVGNKGILRIDVKPNLTDDRETFKALATTGPIAKGTANKSY